MTSKKTSSSRKWVRHPRISLAKCLTNLSKQNLGNMGLSKPSNSRIGSYLEQNRSKGRTRKKAIWGNICLLWIGKWWSMATIIRQITDNSTRLRVTNLSKVSQSKSITRHCSQPMTLAWVFLVLKTPPIWRKELLSKARSCFRTQFHRIKPTNKNFRRSSSSSSLILKKSGK